MKEMAPSCNHLLLSSQSRLQSSKLVREPSKGTICMSSDCVPNEYGLARGSEVHATNVRMRTLGPSAEALSSVQWNPSSRYRFNRTLNKMSASKPGSMVSNAAHAVPSNSTVSVTFLSSNSLSSAFSLLYSASLSFRALSPSSIALTSAKRLLSSLLMV